MKLGLMTGLPRSAIELQHGTNFKEHPTHQIGVTVKMPGCTLAIFVTSLEAPKSRAARVDGKVVHSDGSCLIDVV